MNKSGASWLPRALYTYLEDFCTQTRNGAVTLQVREGRIVSVDVLAHVRVIRRGVISTLEPPLEPPAPGT